MERRDFDLAADMRGQECALFDAVGLRAPSGETWHTILFVGIEEQVEHLSALLRDAQTTGCEQAASPNGGPAEPSGNSGVSGGRHR
jgi:hypothetical protein